MLFIFDWDGTLCDSTGRIVACLQAAAADVGLVPPPHAAALNIIGLGLAEALAELYPGLDDATAQRLRAAYSARFMSGDAPPSQLFAGARACLDALRGQGHLLAVATGKSRRGLDRALTDLALQQYFDATRCADETASKPDPLMVRQLLATLNTPAAQAVVIGDTTYDMEMAARAGVSRIGAVHGAHVESRLQAFAPLFCFTDFERLSRYGASVTGNRSPAG